MKLVKTLVAAFVVGMAALSACASRTGADSGQSVKKDDMKAVIVYFTHSGNTELAVRELAAATGAAVVRLMPEKPYSADDVDWVNEQSRCTREHLDRSLRPAIRPVDVDFAEVDTVFIGFPIWWHEEPAVIRTFLDNYSGQLEGKILYPFCTSYESPMSEADATLVKGFPALTWKKGLRFPATPQQIKKWIEQ